MNFMPFLEYLPGDPFKVKKILSNVDVVLGFIDRQVEEHLKVYSEEEEATDFIHAYVRQIREHEASGNTDTSINGAFSL